MDETDENLVEGSDSGIEQLKRLERLEQLEQLEQCFAPYLYHVRESFQPFQWFQPFCRVERLFLTDQINPMNEIIYT
jgi:hypothetical protein